MKKTNNLIKQMLRLAYFKNPINKIGNKCENIPR